MNAYTVRIRTSTHQRTITAIGTSSAAVAEHMFDLFHDALGVAVVPL